jgi:lantibiotic transport system permease protein
MNLLTSLRSEILKTKRTAALYLSFAAGAIGPQLSLLEMLLDGVPPEQAKTLLNDMFTGGFQMTGFLLLPMFLVLINTLLPQIEYKNNAWKQVITSPQSKMQLFVAKYLNVHLLILIFLITNQLSMLLTATVMHFAQPSLQLFSQPINSLQVWTTLSNSYLALLAIGSIQFWLGLRFKNFIVPISIGVLFWFLGSVMAMEGKMSWATYFPYSFQVYTSFAKYKTNLPVVHLASAGYCAFFLVMGFLDFRKRKLVG